MLRRRRPLTRIASLAFALLFAGGCSAGDAGSPGYEIRGIYDRDLSATGFDHLAELGFNVIDSGPYVDQMDELAKRGLKGMIWLGGYSNERCAFVESDAWVRSRVGDIAGHTAVAAYFVDDEPDAEKCPSAPDQMRARSHLVKSLDPRPPTFLVTYHIDQLELFAGTVDVLALDKYPCKVNLNGCDYAVIHEQAAEADRLGVRYWGVIQAFGDDFYKVPTRDELRQQFDRWRETEMEGYLVFAWRWPDDRPDLWLANNPELQSQLATENQR